MKKIIIAPLAAVVCSATFAADKPEVSVFGVVDVNAAYINKDINDNSRYGIGTNGNSSSRLGFKATQDVGDGLTVGGHLEGAIHPDDGTAAGAGNKGEFAFTRRATLSLSGVAWGEVRAGRDLTPTYSSTSKYDVFGGNGIGQFYGWSNWDDQLNKDADGVRSSNMLAYYSPVYSGFSYGLGYAAHESDKKQVGRYAGLFANYEIAGFETTLAYGVQRGEREGDEDNGTITTVITNGANVVSPVSLMTDREELTWGLSYNLQVAKISALVQQVQIKHAGYAYSLSDHQKKVAEELEKNGGKEGDTNITKTTDKVKTDKFNSYALGAVVPVGKDELKFQVAAYENKQGKEDGDKRKSTTTTQFAVGYVSNLTDNFALYGTLAYAKGDKDADAVNLGASHVYSDGAKKSDDAQIGLQLGATYKF